MSYQSNNQSSLDKLMQMATLEQLNNMIHQMNKNMNANTSSNTNETKDILSLPIVQKVVMAYEDELKIKQSNNCCSCDCQKQVKDYIPLFDEILSKMSEQYHHYNSNLLRVESKVDNLFAFLDRSEKQERQERQDDIPKVDKSQLKLTDFSSFFRKYAIIDLTVASEATTSEATTSEATTSEATTSEATTESTNIPIKEENITLKIEEKYMSDAEDSDDVTEDEDVDDTDAQAVEDPHVTRLIIEEDEDLNEEAAQDEAVSEDEEAIDVEEEDAEDEAVSEEDAEDEDASEAVEEEEESEQEAVSEDAEDEAVEEEEESEEEVRTEDEEEEKDEVKEQEEEVDEDEEVFEIEIDDVTYFATDEENGILYEVDNGEVGRKVGIIKDGEPIFS